jgi:uracil-DNA glycosylase
MKPVAEHRPGRRPEAHGRDLTRLLREIARCRVCRDKPRYRPKLPHAPRPIVQVSPSAKILVASQAPGTRAHDSGTPFHDPSGVRLRAWLSVSEAEFYDASRLAIVPMGFCFPGQDEAGGDLPPRRECALTWHEELLPQLAGIELVLAIGRHAQQYHFRRLGLAALLQPTLSATMNDWRTIWDARQHPRLLPLPHPSWRNTAWLNRSAWFEADLLPVLRAEVRRLMEA